MKITVSINISMAEWLELDDLEGPFQSQHHYNAISLTKTVNVRKILNILKQMYLLIQKCFKTNLLDMNCNFFHVRLFLSPTTLG